MDSNEPNGGPKKPRIKHRKNEEMLAKYTRGKHRKKPFMFRNSLMVLRVKVDGNEQQQRLFTK